MQRIVPAFLFNQGAAEPVELYLSVFKDSSLLTTMPDGQGGLIAANIKLNGMEFLLISGGPECQHSLASSYMIMCDSQDEIDYYWNALSEGGETSYCGWLRDKFGVSWQVTPRRMNELTSSGTPAQAQAVFQAMMGMTKFVIADLEAAFEAAR